MAQTEEFMFQNVAYRPTVYKTGVQSTYTKIETAYFYNSYTLYRLKSNSRLEFNFRFFFSLQSLEKWNGRPVRTPIQCDLKSHSINMRYLRDSPHGDSVGLQDETRRLLRQPISTPTRFRTSMSNTQHQSCRY